MQSTALTFTPSYSPPEAFDGAPASKAGDIYALAATLYALVAGTPPFVTESDESVFALMRRIATESVGDLRTLGVADQVCVVVETAMHKDPEQRHDSAADLASALVTALATAGAPTDPTTRIVAAAAVPPVVATAPPPPATQPLAAPLPAPPAPETDTKRNGMLIVVVVLLILAVGGSTAALIVALSGDDPSGSTDTSAEADEPLGPETSAADAATTAPTTAPTETTAEPSTSAEPTTTTAATTTTPVVVEVPPPTGPAFRSWGVVVDSFADCTAAGIINSSEYPSLTPDLCVELGGTAGSEAGAEALLDPCVSAGCYVRYLGSGPPSGQWVVVWRALATDEVTYQEALVVADTIDAQMGVDFRGYSRLLLSDDYLTFADGFWVVFSRSLETATEAFDFCNEIGAVDCDVQQVFRADGD
jgi:hypothetical protein